MKRRMIRKEDEQKEEKGKEGGNRTRKRWERGERWEVRKRS